MVATKGGALLRALTNILSIPTPIHPTVTPYTLVLLGEVVDRFDYEASAKATGGSNGPNTEPRAADNGAGGGGNENGNGGASSVFDLGDVAGKVQEDMLVESVKANRVPDLLTDEDEEGDDDDIRALVSASTTPGGSLSLAESLASSSSAAPSGPSASASAAGFRVRDLALREFPLLPPGMVSPLYYPLLRICERGGAQDFFVVSKAVEVVRAYIGAGIPMGSGQLEAFLAWTQDQTSGGVRRSASVSAVNAAAAGVDRTLASASALASTMNESSSFTELGVSLLQSLLRYNSVRSVFWSRIRGFDCILSLIAPESNKVQLLYQALNVVWLLSFSPEIATEMLDRGPVVRIVLRVLKIVRKENDKIIRMGIGILANLVELGGHGARVVELGFPKYGRVLAGHPWRDEDISDKLGDLLESLQGFEEDLSSYGQYKEEVLSGSLSWTPVHKSQAFWRGNMAKFENDNFMLISLLVRILSASEDPEILSIAAWDLGEFVRNHPTGKRVLESFGGKDRLMELMGYSDPVVRQEALLAVQKMLVKNSAFSLS